VAYANNYQYDLFVSYARADDAEEVKDGPGWVSQLVLNLERALKLRLGGSDKLRVFFDHRDLGSNHQLEELLSAARRSAVFLAVASRAYADRDWTRRELSTFVEGADDLKRLFAVECLPLDEGERYPEPLQEHRRLRFWRVDEPFSQTPMPLTASQDGFRVLVHDLAEQIRRQLASLNTAASARAAIGRVAEGMAADAARNANGVVVVAQTTDELEEEREQVCRYLNQFGYRVLPSCDYPQGGEAFVAAITSDLARADLFVQLLGPRPGRRPPDLPGGYPLTQFDVARQSGVDVLQWRRPDMDLAAVADPGHRDLLTSENVIAAGLESFKAEARRRLERKVATGAEKGPDPSLVFVNADQTDLDFAKIVQEEFGKRGLTTAIPFFDGPPEAVRSDLQENLIDCDVLVLLYGGASPLWVRGQLKLFNKLRAQRAMPPRVIAIYVGPPAEKPDDVGVTLPQLRRIDSRAAWSVEPIRNLIDELRA
jgi:hypothetical protein